MNWQYLYLFFQSNLLEIGVFYFFYKKHLSLKETTLLVTISNSITHPLVIFGFLKNTYLTYILAILLAELFAILVETAFHSRAKNISPLQALKASTLANLLSWQLGPIFTALIFMRDKL